MGMIAADVKKVFFSEHSDQETMIKPFLNGFDISYAVEKNINNTQIFAYLLKPEEYMSEAFGISKEVLLAYSPYDELQPRAIQAVNMLFNVFPFINRVDSLNCFFISKDQNVIQYAGITTFEGEMSRSIVPFVYENLINNCHDQWYIRNELRKNFYDVDLFGYSLPLREETSFFGRQQIVARYVDSIKRCENSGVFGLRKTGKTSLLFKIDRVVRQQKIGHVFFYDCKSPSYRKLHWNDFLGVICDNIANRLKIRIQRKYDETNIIKVFRYVVRTAEQRNIRIVIIFDEIEYISFNSPMDKHWETEFIDFWQTIWSVQSVHRNLVFILCGVNPSVSETDRIGVIQNPLFGIVRSEYLKGLSEEETRVMIHTLGKRMGMNLSHDAIGLLHQQYNGHPLLLRLCCSYLNRCFSSENRPFTISKDKIEEMQEEIDTELTFYFRHIVSEIQQFYPDEYELFELLASGQITDFINNTKKTEKAKHLFNYGLIGKDSNGKPFVKLPVAGRYVVNVK